VQRHQGTAGAFVLGVFVAGAFVGLKAGTFVELNAGTVVLSGGTFVLLGAAGVFVVPSTGAVLRSGTVPARPVVFSATLLIGGLIPSPLKA
jgi:hypothetical protein